MFKDGAVPHGWAAQAHQHLTFPIHTYSTQLPLYLSMLPRTPGSLCPRTDLEQCLGYARLVSPCS